MSQQLAAALSGDGAEAGERPDLPDRDGDHAAPNESPRSAQSPIAPP